MPLQNRVSPLGELFAAPARGTLLGNRGGKFHRDDRTLGPRRFASRQWICCVLEFKNRRREVWGWGYTELFFLDEVTALAAGHRPCFECRRHDANTFAAAWAQAHRQGCDPEKLQDFPAFAKPASAGEARSDNVTPNIKMLEGRSGATEVDQAVGAPPRAQEMDRVLHAERLDRQTKRLHRHPIDALPDATVIALAGAAMAVRGAKLLPWAPSGYGAARPRPHGGMVDVLTPPTIIGVLAAGYRPRWHASAGA
jgi:hypothetical protein